MDALYLTWMPHTVMNACGFQKIIFRCHCDLLAYWCVVWLNATLNGDPRWYVNWEDESLVKWRWIHRIADATPPVFNTTWWRHQMETISALLAISAGNSPVLGEFPAQRPVTRSFDVFFDLRLNTRLGKQSWGWWFDTLSHPLWRHRNEPVV